MAECDGIDKDNIGIDLEAREATIYTDPDKFNVDDALAKLEAANFPATVKP